MFRTHDHAAPVLVLESEFDTLRSWARTTTRLGALPAVGARGLDAPGRVRRAHARTPSSTATWVTRWAGATARSTTCRSTTWRTRRCHTCARGRATTSRLPQLPRISLNAEGEVDRDHHGNARGGIRLPHLAVPTAQYGPIGTPALCALRGFVKPFPPEQLAALYTSRDDYLARFDAATATRSSPASCSSRTPSRRAPSRRRRTTKRSSVEESAAVHAPHLTVHPSAVVREQVGRDRRDVVGAAGARRAGLLPMAGEHRGFDLLVAGDDSR